MIKAQKFKAFIMRGSVVDLAVGVIPLPARPFGKIVSSLVTDILMPPIGVLMGGVDFSNLNIVIKEAVGTAKPVTLNYGLFINNVIDFLIVAFCVFLVVKGVSSLKKSPPPAEPTEKNCPQCAMLIPIAAKKYGHCTSSIA